MKISKAALALAFAALVVVGQVSTALAAPATHMT